MVEKVVQHQYAPENTQSQPSGNGMGQHYTNPLSMIVRRAVELAKDCSAENILDLACGRGVTSLALAAETNAKSIVAIDIHHEAIGELSEATMQTARASATKSPIRAKVYDAAHEDGYKPLLGNDADDQCDLVVAKDLYPFMAPAQIDRMFTNTQEILRPGGWFMLTAPSTRSVAYRYSAPGPTDNAFYRRLSPSSQEHIQTSLEHFTFTSIANLSRQLEAYGMEMTEAQHIGRSQGWIMAVAQRLA
jgi:cyclopropane fatty-acyl-phospholipid synthase-like methyltransferase